MIVRFGRCVMKGGDQRQWYDLKSATKSIGVTALGLAIQDGKVRLDDRAAKHHPSLGVPPESNRETGWIEEITILRLATQTAGFDQLGDEGELRYEPGTMWSYSNPGPNWLAECLTLTYRRDLKELMFERVFEPIGIAREDLHWRKNSYRAPLIGDGIPNREFGSGISANVDALARIGLLYLREGRWEDQQLIPAEFVRLLSNPVEGVAGLPAPRSAKRFGEEVSSRYGLLWWNNSVGKIEGVPRDAFWAWGARESIILVVPSLDLVVARAGNGWKRPEFGKHYETFGPFFQPICDAVLESN